MHRAVILLVCACAAYAIPEEVDELSPASEDLTPDEIPLDWKPPAYNTYLHDTDKAIAKIKTHFNPDALDDKNDKDFRYVVASYVIYQLAYNVSQAGWGAYNDNYEALVKKYIESAILTPHIAADTLKCDLMYTTQDAIKKVRQIMDNYPVSFVCRAHPAWCDVATWTVLQKVGDKHDQHSAHALEIAGAASGLFLKDFAHTLEAVSKLNVYRYILYAKEEFRPLVAAFARLVPEIEPFRRIGCIIFWPPTKA